MARLNDYSSNEIKDFRDRMHEELQHCAHLQEAAQRCARLLYTEFPESIVLVRLFVTLPFKDLPSRDQDFVTQLTDAKGLLPLLNEKTSVLSLLGTYGIESDWQDRYQSKGHLGIPLVSSSFVGSIPMVSRLMSDMGIDLAGFDEEDKDIVIKSLGQTVGVFYVRDAKTRLDQQNRKIVSAQDFVADYDIKTVFGLGGSYLNGSFVTMIIFTREAVEQSQIERLMLLVNTFKIATMSWMMSRTIFAGTIDS